MAFKILFFYLCFFHFIPQVNATDKQNNKFIQWHSTNIQLLRGMSYELGDDERTLLSFEHANGFKYGDFYVFWDQTWPDTGKADYYIEPTLRLSLSKMTGKDFSYGVIKDVLLSGQLEKPQDRDLRTLTGMAVDFNVPGFKFFKTNLFLRDNPELSGTTYQATIAWNRPFNVGRYKFLAEGFADLAGSEGSAEAYQLYAPRFLMDIGHATNIADNKLWLGTEWQYWHNKFGVDGVTESVPQIQLKYVF
jgi:nucleoside-specific outer membrane channel protein Tsx